MSLCLLQLLSQVVSLNTAATGEGCTTIPCCDTANNVATECINISLGAPCLIDLKLCIAGAVGSLLDAVLPNLDLQLAPVAAVAP